MSTRLGIFSASRLGAPISLPDHGSNSLITSSAEGVLTIFINTLRRASPTAKFTITYVAPVVMLGTALANHSIIVWALQQAKDFVCSQITTRVTIGDGHFLQDEVLEWLAENRLKNAHALAVSSVRTRKDSALDTENDSDVWYQDANGVLLPMSPCDDLASEDDAKDLSDLTYVPYIGCYNFEFEGYQMRFEKLTETYENRYSGNHSKYDTVIISCLSIFASAKPLQRFLDHVRKEAAKSGVSTTCIHRPRARVTRPVNEEDDPWRWDYGVSRPRRKLGAVTLDAHIKDPLVKDTKDYLASFNGEYMETVLC